LRVAVLWLGHVSSDTAGRTYLREILGPLGEIAGLSVDVHVADPGFAVPGSCHVVRHRVPLAAGPYGRVLGEQWVAARLGSRYDVLLAPFNNLPATWRRPSVVVQHNVLAFGERVRSELGWIRAWYHPRALRMSLRRATLILTVSDYLRRLLLTGFEWLDPARVRVVPYGVASELAAGEAPTGRVPTSVLVVSALWPYKRVDQAIEAFASATGDASGSVLLIAGPDAGGIRSSLKARASELGVAERVRFLGNVSHDELARLYAEADALVFASEIESFGLPVLEAMAAGVPVVARRIDGVAEIGGEAPAWVDADGSAAELGEQLSAVLRDDEVRRERIAAGRRQASMFSWDAAAQATADALREAAVLHGRR
jgi:glycosyltransferase involved in cell wall biosynthesis